VKPLLSTGGALLATLAVVLGARAESVPPDSRLADRIVAIVNTEPITLFELRRAAAPHVARVLREAGRDERKAAQSLQRVVDETLDALIDDILIGEQAKEMDLTIPPEKVDAHIKKIRDANDWSDDELQEELGKLGFASIADYRRHTEREMLKSQVVGIKVASRVKVEETEVDAALRQQMSTAGKVEERRAAHILIRLDELAPPSAEDAARELLSAARAKILSGETTFAAAAKDLSQDTNKQSGGDLGWFVRGDFDPEFEVVAYATKKGGVSEPFRTRFGVHLVTVTDVRDKQLANDTEIEAMKRQLRYQLREKALERVYGQWVRSLRAGAFVQIKDLGLGGSSRAPEPRATPVLEPEGETTPDDGEAPRWEPADKLE